MSNRFHNKYHRDNHHPNTSLNDVDGGSDPITPFLGDFHASDNILSASGGECVNVILSGPGHIKNSDAKPETVGVIRIATKTEADAQVDNTIAITPDDLHEFTSGTPPHKLLSPAHNDTIVPVGEIQKNSIFNFNGTKWTSASTGVINNFATDPEVVARSESKAVTSKQLYTEIKKNKVIYVEGANSSSAGISAVFASLSATPAEGTLAFFKFNTALTQATWGNHGTAYNYNWNIGVWKYTSGNWVRIWGW